MGSLGLEANPFSQAHALHPRGRAAHPRGMPDPSLASSGEPRPTGASEPDPPPPPGKGTWTRVPPREKSQPAELETPGILAFAQAMWPITCLKPTSYSQGRVPPSSSSPTPRLCPLTFWDAPLPQEAQFLQAANLQRHRRREDQLQII